MSSSASSASSASLGVKTYSLFSSSTQTAAIKLDRINYMMWEATIRPLIIGNRLLSHIDGVTVAPPTHLTVDGQQVPNLDFEEWFVVDNLLLGWLRNSMSLEIGSQLLHCTTARALWNGAKTLTSASTRSRVMMFKSELHHTRKGSLKMNEYLAKMKGISYNLALARAPVAVDDLILHTLNGLEADFNPVSISTVTIQPAVNVAQTETESKTPSFDKTPWRGNGSRGHGGGRGAPRGRGRGGKNGEGKSGSNDTLQESLPNGNGPTTLSEKGSASPRGPTTLLDSRASPAATCSDSSNSNTSSKSASDSRATHADTNSDLGRDSGQPSSHIREHTYANVGPSSQTDTEQAQLQNHHQMVTRSRVGLFKPKLPYVGLVNTDANSGSLSSLNSSDPEPKYDSKSLTEFTRRLNSVFALKDLGPLYYFLGIEVYRDQSGIYLNQSKYAQDVLKRFNMASCASVSTLMVTGRKFTAQEGEKMSYPSLFRRVIGSLQYLTTTIPDLAFSSRALHMALTPGT
ncbi:glutamate receptor [Senna tora]|uniref:Glutamate receptor n=1 Tax=Senna tora TaxID=362788 RepID=A0A835C5M1_9FABA|nr:glutamate receptor [Senna tora]